MSKRFIGVDAGGTMTKVVLFDAQGNELGCERRPNIMLFPKVGWTERDGNAMWRATCESIRHLLQSTGTDPADIAAVTPSGYGGGVYLVDRNGEPVRNGLVSTDTRVLPLIERWKTTGMHAAVTRQIEQQMWGGQTLAILAWMQENEPEIVERTAHVLGCKDFLRMRLSGDVSTDATDAGCGGLINVTRGEISREALEAAGMTVWLDKLAPVGSPTEIVGGISARAAAETGLLEGTPVVRGVYDVVGCALATGVTRPDQLAVVAGTFAIHSTIHDRPSLNPLPTIQTPYPVDGRILATIATPTSASNLEWLVRTMLSSDANRALLEGRNIFDVCNMLVAEMLNRDNDILFFPFLFGGPNGAPAGFLGMVAGVDFGDLVRALYEGVVFAHRYDMDYLLGGPDSAKPTTIRLAGGPSRSDVWAQMFADGLGMPVELTDGSELGAKGGAICASVATGLYRDIPEAIANMVRVVKRFEPQPVRQAIMAKKFRRFRQVMDCLASVWAQSPDAESAETGPVQSLKIATK